MSEGSSWFPGHKMIGTGTTPASTSGSGAGIMVNSEPIPLASADPRVPLYNLSILRRKMDSLRQFISQSLDQNKAMGKDQMDSVSTEIVSAIHQIIVNGAALVACSSMQNLGSHVGGRVVPMAGKVPDTVELNAQTTSSVFAEKEPDLRESISGTAPMSSLITGNFSDQAQMKTQATSSLFTGKGYDPSDLIAGIAPRSTLVTGKAAESLDLTTQTNYPVFERSLPERALIMPDFKVPVPDFKVPASSKVASVAELEIKVEIGDDDSEIIELDAVELLAEHIHFCEICGKGFKRDANLRMHMRAHGNQFKTPEALAKPERFVESRVRLRFSCPLVGCNRNKSHKKFRPLKSVICVKNHFKRSHCPKMFSCNRCNKKSFSVLTDLRSHLKHCGESKWRCTCGTSFSRKDKLFGHMALFEGHMPAVVAEGDEKLKGAVVMEEDEVEVEEEEEEETQLEEGTPTLNGSENEFFDGLLDGFGGIDAECWKDVLQSPGLDLGMDDLFNF